MYIPAQMFATVLVVKSRIAIVLPNLVAAHVTLHAHPPPPHTRIHAANLNTE